jgi:hypothetical protein
VTEAVSEALRMLDTFISVGARSFVVTSLDINQARIWPLPYHVKLGMKYPRLKTRISRAPSSERSCPR